MLIKLEFSCSVFEEYSDIRFQENTSSGSRVPCGRTDMTKLIVAFRGFADAPQLGLRFTKIGYMFRPMWPSLGAAAAETYKGRPSPLSYTTLLC